jgi:hypothetical protein
VRLTFVEKEMRTASFAAGIKTTTRATWAWCTGTTTTRRIVTTALAFRVPERIGDPDLNRPISMALPAAVGICRNEKEVGVLIASVDTAPKAHRPRVWRTQTAA